MHLKRPSLYKKQQGKRWSHHFRDYKPSCFLPCYRTIWYYIPRTIWQMCNSVKKTIEWFHSLCQTQYRLILAPRVNAFILQKNYLNNWKKPQIFDKNVKSSYHHLGRGVLQWLLDIGFSSLLFDACTSILQCLRSQPLKNASCPAFF